MKIGYTPRDRLPFKEEVNQIFPTNRTEYLADYFEVDRKTIGEWIKHGLPQARAKQWEEFKKVHARAMRKSR